MTSPQATPLPDSMLATGIICMSRSKLITTLFYLYGWLPITILGILAIVALIAGIAIDVRWAIIFLMVVFIITPLLMSFLYFFHGLRPTTAANVVPHTLIFTNNGITIRILEEKKEEESDIEVDPKAQNDAATNAGNDADTELGKDVLTEKVTKAEKEKEIITRYEFSIPYTSIDRYQLGRDGFIISLKQPQQGFIWLPYAVFSKREDMETALKRIQSHLAS
ncbi:MAG: hypothetical protein K2J63_04325 [Muribaculaceae bacterium]|nr:hypothetical protein [Muribaculaceae bacterium]